MRMVFAIEQKTHYLVFNAAKKALFELSYISAYSYPCKITHIIVYHPHTKNQDMNNDLSYRTMICPIERNTYAHIQAKSKSRRTDSISSLLG